MKPQFSIILPTHNRSRLLKRAVESALNQSFKDFELIIVDDGCDDNTFEYLHSLSHHRIRIIRHRSPQGVSAARNSGIHIATGSFVAFLDDDDELLPQFLSRFHDHFITNPNLGWSWSGIRKVYWRDEVSIKEERDQYWIVADAQKLYLTQLAASCGLIIQKSWLDRLGGFDESMTVAEDRDLLMRLEMSGASCAPLPEVLIRIHIHPGTSLSRTTDNHRFVQSYRTLIEKNKSFMEMYPILWRRQYESLIGHLYRVGEVKEARSLVWKIFCRNPWRLAGLEKFIRFEIKRI